MKNFRKIKRYVIFLYHKIKTYILMKIGLDDDKAKYIGFGNSTLKVKTDMEYVEAVVRYIELFMPSKRKLGNKEREFLIASVILRDKLDCKMYKDEFNIRLMEDYGFRSKSSVDKYRNILVHKKWLLKQGHTFEILPSLNFRKFADEMEMSYKIKKEK